MHYIKLKLIFNLTFFHIFVNEKTQFCYMLCHTKRNNYLDLFRLNVGRTSLGVVPLLEDDIDDVRLTRPSRCTIVHSSASDACSVGAVADVVSVATSVEVVATAVVADTSFCDDDASFVEQAAFLSPLSSRNFFPSPGNFLMDVSSAKEAARFSADFGDFILDSVC